MFFDRLKEFRRAGESDRAFAGRIGVSPQVLFDFKRGAWPRYPTAQRIAKLLGVAVPYLLDGWGPQTEREANQMWAEWQRARMRAEHEPKGENTAGGKENE